MSQFSFEGHRLKYSVYGDGPQVTVLNPALLFSQRMHGPLADALADRGHRVITLDLLGHGQSDRPQDMSRYSMKIFAQQVLALLDHLEIERAVIGGTSLGANVTLNFAELAPERLQGMVVEMPVLDNALLACALAFTPMLAMLTFGEPVMKGVQLAAKALPQRPLPLLGKLLSDWVRQDPGPSAAVLQGLFSGQISPPRGALSDLDVPTLVIGHRRDPVHPFSDAGMLADELPRGELMEANSILEMRIRPQRITERICDFVESCWRTPAKDTGDATGKTVLGQLNTKRRAVRATGKSR